MDWGQEEKPLTEVTLLQLEKLCESCFDIKRKIDKLEDQQKALQEELSKNQKTLIAHLTQYNKSNYDSSYGKVIVQNRTSSKVTNKDELFKYLKDKGQFESLVSVHSQTLNSYCKQELEAALEAGNPAFQVPGVQMTDYQTLSMRKR